VAYLVASGAVALAATVLWVAIARRAIVQHRIHSENRTLREAAVALACLMASLGAVGSLMSYAATEGIVPLSGLDSAGRMMSGAGEAALLVVGIGIVWAYNNRGR